MQSCACVKRRWMEVYSSDREIPLAIAGHSTRRFRVFHVKCFLVDAQCGSRRLVGALFAFPSWIRKQKCSGLIRALDCHVTSRPWAFCSHNALQHVRKCYPRDGTKWTFANIRSGPVRDASGRDPRPAKRVHFLCVHELDLFASRVYWVLLSPTLPETDRVGCASRGEGAVTWVSTVLAL